MEHSFVDVDIMKKTEKQKNFPTRKEAEQKMLDFLNNGKPIKWEKRRKDYDSTVMFWHYDMIISWKKALDAEHKENSDNKKIHDALEESLEKVDNAFNTLETEKK